MGLPGSENWNLGRQNTDTEQSVLCHSQKGTGLVGSPDHSQKGTGLVGSPDHSQKGNVFFVLPGHV